MGASQRALALACASFACMVCGAAYAALPQAAGPAIAAAAVLPLRTSAPAVTDSASPLPVGYGEPHRTPVVTSSAHASHVHHLAVTAARTTAPPAPVPSPSTSAASLPSTAAATAPATPAPAPTPTQATATASPQAGPGSGVGAELLAKALTMQGVPYVYGGATPGGFDCSGLVYWAAQQLGISMPRDTYSMLAQGVSSGLLVQVAAPEYGDLAFFGSGHVEFWIRDGETFGAQSPGTAVGYHGYGYGYVPTAFYRIT
jgi:cell wall-associated NlpC family hydrolase